MLGHLTSTVCMLHAGLPHEVQGPAQVVKHTKLKHLQDLLVEFLAAAHTDVHPSRLVIQLLVFSFTPTAGRRSRRRLAVRSKARECLHLQTIAAAYKDCCLHCLNQPQLQHLSPDSVPALPHTGTCVRK